MSKNKKASPHRAAPSPEETAETLIQSLAELALALTAHDGARPMSAALRAQDALLRKTIRKCLLQRRDEVLYEALDRIHDLDAAARQFLQACIEDAAGEVLARLPDGRERECNAFVIPVFVRSSGGLLPEHCCQDQDAFQQLTASIKASQLESAAATVVLAAHAYHLDELDRITYCQINEMTREAMSAMSGKKTAMPANEKSVSGWPPSGFGADDVALELRFLLGFALKQADDPFYRVPDEENAADAYFDQRMQRFQRWTELAEPLVRRCLSRDDRVLGLNFLYQDLFHDAKRSGMAELSTLEMMAALRSALNALAQDAAGVRAELSIVDDGDTDDALVCVSLYRKSDESLLTTAEKPLTAGSDTQAAFDDACDALATIGISDVALAHSS